MLSAVAQPVIRAVIDTNVLVSTLIFSAGQLQWLLRAWRGGRILPLLDHDTAAELIRVMTYPKFKLTRDERDELLGDLLPHAEIVETGSLGVSGLPPCRDPDDVKFLKLASVGRADLLITGDKDLLDIADRFPIRIVTPSQAREVVEN